MAREKKKAAAGPRVVKAVPVAICAYRFSDEALDELIDLSFRIFERVASRPDVVAKVARLMLLVNHLQHV